METKNLERSNSSTFLELLKTSVRYANPITPSIFIDGLTKEILAPEELKVAFELSTEGAIIEFSRGFQKEALNYLAIAAHVKKIIRERQVVS